MRGVNRQTDWRILKEFFPRFRIQSEILRDFRILQYCRFIHFFGPRFWTLGIIKIFLPEFRIQAKFSRQIWLINHNRSVDLHPPIHPPLELITVEPRFNEVPRDCRGNLFVKFRVSYIEHLCLTSLWQNYENVRYIEV